MSEVFDLNLGSKNDLFSNGSSLLTHFLVVFASASPCIMPIGCRGSIMISVIIAGENLWVLESALHDYSRG